MLYSNRLVLPTLYRGLWLDGDPITYNDVLITYPSNCTQYFFARFTACDYSVVLGDGAIIPSPPDLNSASYVRYFIAWNRDSLNSFIDFDLTTATTGIRFQFTVLHDFDWFFLSEVRFCTDLQQPEVTFQTPSSNYIQPSAGDLRRRSTELVCTVSSEGSYSSGREIML